MIGELSHVTLLVDDLDEALAYYTDVLGFHERDDVDMGEMGRWLTVSPGAQELPQFSLMEPETDEQRERVGAQVPGYVAFVLGTDDCRAEYDRLREAGVEFHGEPEDNPWGVEARFEDRYGNVFDLVEPHEMDEEAMAAMMDEAAAN
ncbi:VOC family protein [Halomarina rubra]|uniref:VOC family protein n=1 Tax=Halomarina rubra TaxID=2071873 RepID=A0ABD6AR27_9EURY|nr:VOC family protein [Halomarina rubra]